MNGEYKAAFLAYLKGRLDELTPEQKRLLFSEQEEEQARFTEQWQKEQTRMSDKLTAALRALKESSNLAIVDFAVYNVPAPAPNVSVEFTEGAEAGEQRSIGVPTYWRFDVYVDMKAFMASYGLPQRELPGDTFRTGGVLSDVQIAAEESLVDALVGAIAEAALGAYVQPGNVVRDPVEVE